MSVDDIFYKTWEMVGSHFSQWAQLCPSSAYGHLPLQPVLRAADRELVPLGCPLVSFTWWYLFFLDFRVFYGIISIMKINQWLTVNVKTPVMLIRWQLLNRQWVSGGESKEKQCRSAKKWEVWQTAAMFLALAGSTSHLPIFRIHSFFLPIASNNTQCYSSNTFTSGLM